MSRFPRHLLLVSSIMLSALAAWSQEPWDTSIRLSAIRISKARDARIAQDMGGAISAVGVYPVSRNLRVVTDLGYLRLLDLSRDYDAASTDPLDPAPGVQTLDRLDGFFAGAYCRYAIPWNNLYAQAGLRGAATTARHYTSVVGDTSGNRISMRGSARMRVNPAFAIGARFTERHSAEVGLSRITLQDAVGREMKANLLEFSLAIHL